MAVEVDETLRQNLVVLNALVLNNCAHFSLTALKHQSVTLSVVPCFYCAKILNIVILAKILLAKSGQV